LTETNNCIVGVKFLASQYGPGFGIVPLVPFPTSKAERTRAEKEASKVALLLRKPSAGQLALFRHLVEGSPDKSYIVTSSKWIETILKATQRLSEADIERLRTFDWAERRVTAAELRRELLSALKAAKPDEK
jgi:hypothetical protein